MLQSNPSPNKNESAKSDNRRIVAYCRVSTAMQGSGLSAQIRQVREHCKRNNLEGIEIYTDENQSGAKSSRPGLDKMMEEVRKGNISMVIVPSFSRLARSTTHLLKALDEFKMHNCSFVSLSEALDTDTAAGKMAFTVLAAVSQLERELIIERVRVGLANARAQGKQIGRKKTRPSDLIRKLHKAGYKYREISRVAGVSHGSISRELKELRKEEMQAFAKTLSIEETKPPEKKETVFEEKSEPEKIPKLW